MSYNRKLILLFSLVNIIDCFGTIGYMLIEDWSLNEALYMTAITLTTTGYGEVHPLSDAGRIFTMLLLATGVGTFAYITSTFFTILSLNFPQRRAKRMQRKINKLSDHAIILGFGRMGSTVAENLAVKNFPLVIIERRPELIKRLEETDFLFLEGDAANDEKLKDAGVERAKFLVSTVDDDADGLFASVAAKAMNPHVHVILRANSTSARKKMLLAGADEVVVPFSVSGQSVANSILNPGAKAVVDLTSMGAENEFLEFINVEVTKESPFLGKSLNNCGLKRDGFMVIGIKRKKKFNFAPAADEVFNLGDTIITVCTKANLDKRHIGPTG